MARPICVDCELEMVAKKTGCLVEKMTNKGPYQLFMGDMYECPNCNVSVVCGLGKGPIVEHFENDYATRVEREKAELKPWMCIRSWSNLIEYQEFHGETKHA